METSGIKYHDISKISWHKRYRDILSKNLIFLRRYDISISKTMNHH